MTSTKTGRPRKIEGESHRLVMTLDADTVTGLDEWVEEIRASQIGGSGTARTDLIRDILARAVDDHRRERRKKGSKK
jgi:hypothetical protein